MCLTPCQPLCSGLLCAGHMDSRQRRAQVDGPLWREASVTSLVTTQRNDQPASGTEQTLMTPRSKKWFWTCSRHTGVIFPYYRLHLCVITRTFGAWVVIINRSILWVLWLGCFCFFFPFEVYLCCLKEAESSHSGTIKRSGQSQKPWEKEAKPVCYYVSLNKTKCQATFSGFVI